MLRKICRVPVLSCCLRQSHTIILRCSEVFARFFCPVACNWLHIASILSSFPVHAQGVIACLLGGTVNLSKIRQLSMGKPAKPTHSRHGSLSSLDGFDLTTTAASFSGADNA